MLRKAASMKRRNFLALSGLTSIYLPVISYTKLWSYKTDNAKSETDFIVPDINELRKLSKVIVGDLPIKINVTKVADTIRPANVVVEGASENEKMTLARTVYQIEFSKGNVMIDTGMDLETHKTFGKTEEPFYPENFEMVNKALLGSNLIILTHYHADHTAGIVRSKDFEKLAHKVWLTKDTAKLMLEKPHKPTIEISKEKLSQFNIVDFEMYYPIAPGVVIFKAPGHTSDSKMLYIKLANGKEFIHSVDSGWSIQNIIQEKMKNASWVNESKELLLLQYKWLNKIMKENPEIYVLCTHDNEQYSDFIKRGILGGKLKI